MTAEQIIRECTQRLEQVREQTLTFVQQARECINKLNRIALQPESVTIEGYIDIMIEAERATPGEDQPMRVQTLIDLKEKESLRKRITRGEPVLPDIPKTKSLRRPKSLTKPGREVADGGVIIPEGLPQMDNMTHVVEVINSNGGRFLGKLRKVFKRE